jgi:CheY-like chemotaxis protein
MDMRVLIVEDDPERMVGFNKWFLPEGDKIFWAKTAAAGIEALGFDTFDLVMLDHDLADAHYMNIEHTAEAAANFALEHTGQDVARHIAAMDNPPPFVFVHSWNPTGAIAMENILKDAGIRTFRSPFGSDDLKRGIIQYRKLHKELFEA